MKSSLNMWSYPGPANDLGAYGAFLAKAKDAGFQAVEPTLDGPLNPDSPEDEVARVRQVICDAGLEVASLACGAYWQFPFTANDPAIRAKAVELTEKVVRIARWLGTDAVLVIPGMVAGLGGEGEVVSYDVCYERALAELAKTVPAAERAGVRMGLENVWNKFLLSPLEMAGFVDAIGSECVGVYFDVGNVVAFGYPEHWIRILGKRIVRVHLKDFKRSVGTIDGFCPLGTGDVDWVEVKRALQDAGYDGYLSCEIGPVDDDELRKSAELANSLCG